jgi:hypothetical protein
MSNQYHQDSLSQQLVKGIDYLSEEYIKQAIENYTQRKLSWMRPFIGSIVYPSGQFFTTPGSYTPTVQFQSTLFIGYIDMLLPVAIKTLTGDMAYTKLTFKLDGITRTFIQLTGGDTDNGLGLKFSQYVQTLFADANLEIPFNHSAIHILEEFTISGSDFELTGTEFTETGFTSGVHTPDYRFQITCSGYNALLL